MPAHFVVSLKNLEKGSRTIDDPIGVDWLAHTLADTEATPAGQPGRLLVQLSKNGRDVLVRGPVEVCVVMACARTLAPITLDLKPEMLLLLRKSEEAPEVQPRRRRGRNDQARQGGPKASAGKGGKGGNSGKGGKGGWAADPELHDEDAAVDTFSGERIELDSFIREFALLELPMFPVRQDLPSIKLEARASPPSPSSGQKPVDPRLLPLEKLKARMAGEDPDKE
jgi:uncharacterized metal-binding protein YceD (DUF177 family)